MKGKRIQRVLAIMLVISMMIIPVVPSSMVVSADANMSQTLKKVPVLAANIYNKATGENAFTPYITKDIKVAGKTLKVGILGIENTDCSRFDVPDNYPGLVFAHPENTKCSIAWEVNRYLPNMKAEGCDFIIVSYHAGKGDKDKELVFGTNTEDQVERMISETTDVDVVVAGHDHKTNYSNTYIRNREGKNVLVVNGGGTQLTKTVFQVTYDKATGFSIGVKNTENVELSKYEDDKALANLIKPAVDKATKYVNQECGVIKEGDWTTSSDFYLEQTDTMDLINRAQMSIADKYLAELGQNKVKISSTSVVVNGNYTVKPGKISLKDIYTMYRYENYLYIVPLTGKEIRIWLEGNAEENFSYSIENGTVKFGLGKNKFTNPVFYGVDFQYDLAKAVGNRITGLKFADGSEVKDNETYNVAINSYHIGQAPFTRTGKTIKDAVWSSRDALGDDKGTVQQMIAEFIRDCTEHDGGVSIKRSNWGLTFSKDVSTFRIPVFETSDVHGTLVDTSSSKYQYRLARIADAVNDIRNESKDVLLLDAGDIYQGTPVSNLLGGEPMIAAYDAMKYDAVGLGNHEFDWGVTTLLDPDGTMGSYDLSAQVKGDSKIPVLCNNITYKENGEKVNFTKDYKIVEKKAVSLDGKTKTVKIGIIGYVEDYSSDIMTERIAPYKITEDMNAVEKQAIQLKESGQADVIVLLTHAGAPDVANQLEKDTEIDLVLGGHTHKDNAGITENGVPYVQPQNAGKSYGYAELCIDPETKEISVENQQLVNIYKNKETLYNTLENKDNLDTEIVKISDLAVSKVAPTLKAKLGYVKTEITKALIPGSLSSIAGMWMSDLANRATGSKVSFTNAGGIRTEFLMEQGAEIRTITKGDIYTIAPFNNQLYVYDVDYSRLKEALDYTVKTASDPGLRISGVTVYYEKEQVNAIILDGKAIYKYGVWLESEETPIRLCTNQYVGTLPGTPFADWTPVETSRVDNESFMEVLEKEAEQSDGYLKVETEANVIQGRYEDKVENHNQVRAVALSLHQDDLQTKEAEFVLMTTTDMHGKCWYRNILNETAVNNSYLRVSSVVNEARSQYGNNVILIDNGDVYQGSPISAYNIQCGGKENPMSICLKYIGYDVSVLGNHEFNYSFATMQKIYDYMENGTQCGESSETPEVSPSPSANPSEAPEVIPTPSVKPSTQAVKKVTVSLNANGGYFKNETNSKTVSKTVSVKGKYGLLATPVRKGYVFARWYTGKTSGSKVTSATMVTNQKNHTLYAHWTKVTAKKSAITSLANAKDKKVLVKVQKVSDTKGYQIMYSADKAFKKSKAITTASISNKVAVAKKGQTYYFKVRTYKVDSTGARVYSGWSNVKSKKTVK